MNEELGTEVDEGTYTEKKTIKLLIAQIALIAIAIILAIVFAVARPENATDSTTDTQQTTEVSTEAESMNGWYYLDENNKKQGPYSGDEMIEIIKQGKLDGETLAFTKGMPEWMPLNKLAIYNETARDQLKEQP